MGSISETLDPPCPAGEVETAPKSDAPGHRLLYTTSDVEMIRILIADPDRATRKALALLLRRKLGTDGIVEVQDTEALIRALARSHPTCSCWIENSTVLPHPKIAACSKSLSQTEDFLAQRQREQ